LTYKSVRVILYMEVMELKNLKVKFARLEKDISQTELAKRVGVTRQTIGMIEAGDYNPTLKLCVAICRELDKTLNDLFWEEEVDDEEKTR
jgi:putative transcriptional regulator